MDSEQHAASLPQALKGIRSKVNVIPFIPNPGTRLFQTDGRGGHRDFPKGPYEKVCRVNVRGAGARRTIYIQAALRTASGRGREQNRARAGNSIRRGGTLIEMASHTT